MKVSIIVPTRNRSALLHKTLISLLTQNFPEDQYEIIVVDNGSTDDTKEIVGSLIQNDPCNQIRYLYEPEPGLLAGRHRGAVAAMGALLCFVDDDIEAVHGWLAAIVGGFDDNNVQLVGGRSSPKYEVDCPTWIESFWETTPDGGRYCGYLSLLDLGQRKLEITPNHIFGLNFAIRRNTFHYLGGFHPDGYPDNLLRFTGDGEGGLTMAAETRGYVAIYQPEAIVYHFVPVSRMTPEYFERGAYSEGISDSYLNVRRNGGLGIALLAKMRRLASKVKHVKRSSPAIEIVLPKDRIIVAIQKRVKDARQAGFEFHQRAIRTDPSLLDWVLKPNYWDYRLPR